MEDTSEKAAGVLFVGLLLGAFAIMLILAMINTLYG